MRDSRTEIENHWSLDDLIEAHIVIDALEEIEIEAAREAKKG